MTNKITRRTMLGTAAVGVAAAAAGAAEAQNVSRRRRPARKLPNYPNEHYYKDGKFDVEIAKDAVIELLQYHGYPLFPKFRENLYVSDFNLGKFTEVGLAGIFFVSNLDGEFSYMMQDLFLMPNQMLPEHWHIKPEDAKTGGAQKDEGWYVRWGRSYIVGIGEPNLPPEVKVPEVHGNVTVEHCTVADPGVFVPLTERGSHHWQMGGSEGVILTEVANYHSDKFVRLLNETANKAFGN